MWELPALRIGILTTEYPTESAAYDGGLAQYLGRLVPALRSRGHDVEVFVSSDRDESFAADGVVVNRVRAHSRAVERAHRLACRMVRGPMETTFNETAYCLAVAASLRRAFLKRHREKRFDLVQSANISAAPLFLSRRRSPVPVVVRISGDPGLWMREYGLRRTLDGRLADWLSWRGCRGASAVYCPSEFLAKAVRGRRGLPAEVVPPTFQIETSDRDFSVVEKAAVGRDFLLFHGTLGRLKGIGVIVEALETVLAGNPDLHMILIGRDAPMGEGRGSGAERIQGRLGRFGGRVVRLDRLSHAQLYPFLARARGSVLPSLVDNLPNAALEAMAFGRVVIGTHGTGMEELIENGRSGLLVEPGNSEQLASAMDRLWRMPEEERRRMGEAALRSMDRFSPGRTLPILESLFHRVLAVESRRVPGLDAARSGSECATRN